jgi:quercetin dioxygenase-like cupin family protein
MIRCVKLWTGADGKSHFQEGFVELELGARGDALSAKLAISLALFHETDVDPKLGWHPDGARQLVISLSGTLKFETPDGAFMLHPGDVLFTEDTRGAGHNWTMMDGEPWRRLYTILEPDTSVPFRPAVQVEERCTTQCSKAIRRKSMIRCVRLWTGEDDNSHFEEGVIELEQGQRGDSLSNKIDVLTASFQETASGGTFSWHTAPIRQLVITLSGTLDFQTRDGHHFVLQPGDVLLAEDTAGSGHSWKLTDDASWRRAYVVLRPGAQVPFRSKERQTATA